MTSEISRQLVTLGEELKRKREICCDVSVSPVSLLFECSQVTKVPLAFKEICDFKKGLFSYEVKYGDHSATGSGSTKKESKRIAAENLVSKAIKSVSVKSDSETHVKDEISSTLEHSEEPEIRQTQISTWKEILSQLSHKETDTVILLDIFALNSSTDSPKYQVTKTVMENKKKVGYKVMTSWNMFFMEAEAKTRVEAERKSALKMVNKIRELCGLDEIPEEKCVENIEEDEDEDDSTILNDEDIPEEIRVLLTKHEETLTDANSSLSSVKKLETFSEQIQCPVLPSYSIINVVTEGCQVVVEVEVTWLSLTSTGSANTRSAADEQAAFNMIQDAKNIIKKLKKIQAKVPPIIEKDSDPVQYLIFPSQKSESSIPSTAGVTVTSNDYLCLQKGQYLNDVIVDFYLKYLQYGLLQDNALMTNTYIFSIFFYSRLTSKSKVSADIPQATLMHNNVKKWTKNVNIFEKDFIVVPINECDHWFVVIICFPNPEVRRPGKRPIIIVLDSLEDGRKNSVCNNLRTYLTMEWRAKMSSERTFSVSDLPAYCPRIPQQTNMTDCGIFLLQYVESFFSCPLTKFSPPLENLVSWFPEDCIENKRNQIARIIRELSSENQSKTDIQFPNLDFGYSTKLEPETSETPSNESLEVSKEAESNLKRRTSEDETDVKKFKEDSSSAPAIDWLEDY